MYLLKPKAAPLSLLLPTLVIPPTYAFNESDIEQGIADHSNKMKTIIVVASRMDQSVSDVAGSVAVVDSEDIEKKMANNIEESLRYIPGVSMNGNSRFGASDFNVRGMDGSRVKVLIDGVEQPVAYASGISGTVMNVLGKGQGQVEVDTLTAIEVNKGSSSSLYGSGALGGSVLMRTKSADSLLEGKNSHVSVDVGYQSRDSSYKTTVNAARQFDENLKGMLVFTHRDGNELETYGDGADVIGEHRGLANPMNYSSNNILSKLEFQTNDDHRFTLMGQYFEQKSDGQNLSLDGTSIGFNTYSNYRFKDSQRRGRVGVEHSWDARHFAFDNLTWQVNWQYSEAKNTTKDTLTSKFTPWSNTDRTRQRNAEDSSIQLDVQFNKSFTAGNMDHDFIYGTTLIDSSFTLKTHDTNSKGADIRGVVEMPPKTDVRKAGVFAQDQMYLMNDNLILTSGLRYDIFHYHPIEDNLIIDGNLGEYKDLNSNAFTGQFGGLYHINDSISIFAKYARGFKTPTPEELYYSFERNPMQSMHVIVLANPDLKPETSDSIEMGIRHNNHASNWELTGYYNNYSDFINSASWTKTHDGSTYMYTQNKNIDKAHIYGVELSGVLQLDEIMPTLSGTYLRVSSAWAKGENKDTGDAIDSVAPLTGVLGIGFDQANGVYGWETTLTAVSGKNGNDWSDKDNLSAPGYGIIDVTGYARPMKNLTIRGGIFNLFNKKYWNYTRVKGLTASSVSNSNALTSPGINFGINAKYVF